ncbi:MAG: hypothetical protein ABS89_07570 [Thiobacillus sp. SCN 63-1177]|nr:MAG: hypothetical protein ABS89_07570 [Thiobacillus sp. SCN 63-1177]
MPKQLPPTNFFDRAESDLDDEDVESDLESILDECLGASLPTMNLAWHYRSRNESLIAFSNHRYYGGSLVTFPSPVTEDRAVSFHPVNGVYEKGGVRINKAEARALVADLVGRLKSPGFRESKLTIGVVTFNTEQQGLIEDLLDEERRKDPAIEPWFSDIELEPVFVKNLESVQGDERDIMYFSITYGPDLHGAVSMNFGPMNRTGGERRLNVAITRARHELRVFSSLKAEQMDLARTQAVGVRDLKLFLEFAERGTRALAEAHSGSQGGFESPFEETVAAALARKGWQLHTQIGASAFRIDLAVVHPDAQGVYLYLPPLGHGSRPRQTSGTGAAWSGLGHLAGLVDRLVDRRRRHTGKTRCQATGLAGNQPGKTCRGSREGSRSSGGSRSHHQGHGR